MKGFLGMDDHDAQFSGLGLGFTKDILRKMASECTKDPEEIEKIYFFCFNEIHNQSKEFHSLHLLTIHYLAWGGPLSGWKSERRASALKEIDKIINYAEKLYDLSPKINFERAPVPRGVEEYMYFYLRQKPKNYGEEIEKWNAFHEILNNQIEHYKSIKCIIQETGNPGRPEHLTGLKDFVYRIAIMYQDATGRPFTVDKMVNGTNNKLEPQTEGMRFVYRSTKAITNISCTPAIHITPQNFMTVCEYVCRELKSEKTQKK
jgi:hypothetical protein